MAQRKDVSIQFIAEQCGVSTATVSRVLNGDRRVAEKTRALVSEALDKFHYVMPTSSAPANPRIGVIIDIETSDYYMALVTRVHEYMKKAGMRVIMISLDHDLTELPACLETVYDCGISGVILVSCDYLSIREKLNEAIPHVWIDCNDPPEVTKTICQVQSDQYYSGMLAAQELLKKGCKKPIILSGTPITHRARDRERGFREEFRKRNIAIADEQLVYMPGVQEILAESRQMIRYMISNRMEFDSVFAISDWRSLGVYLALTGMGLRVPEDVKIIGFDGVSIASRSVLNITSVQQNISLIARSACDMLLDMMNGTALSGRRVIVPTDILPGQTV